MSSVESIALAVSQELEDAKLEPGPGQAFVRVITGRFRGIHVRVTCTYRNSAHSYWVESKGRTPPLLASVRPWSGSDRAAAKRGAVVPVPTGDAAFDRDFLIEGAPVDTVRQLFDAETRLALSAASGALFDVEDGRVRGGNDGAAYGARDVHVVLEAVIALRKRLAGLTAGAGEDSALRARAEREIAELRARRGRLWARASWPARLAIALLVVTLALALLGFLVGTFVPS